MTSRQLVRLAPLVLLQGLVIGWLLRPYYDHWALERYARASCGDEPVLLIIEHQIECGTPQ